MKNFLLFYFLFIFKISYSQSIKVAILDFENTSGKIEYDALGKAMSSMLITDLKNNIHPKKVDFFERAQLNKLLDEQKLQKSKNFDAKTAVDFGKLSGVNYVFVGSVFVLDGNCNISSKLVDVKTSKIILSKEANGKIETWLQLKSELAESIANQLNNPVSLDPAYKSQSTTLATLNQYGKIITTIDKGDLEKAEQMRGLFEETNPDFKYFKDLADDIEKLKQRVAELENVTGLITNSFDLGVKSIEKYDYKNAMKYFKEYIKSNDVGEYAGNKKLYAYTKLAYSYLKTDSIEAALKNIRNALKIFEHYPEALEIEIVALKKLGQDDLAKSKIDFLVHKLNLMLEIENFPKDFNCSYIGGYVSAYNFGTTTQTTGKIPNQILWYLVYNQSQPGLNKWGLKFNKDDYACFYDGIQAYGYDSRYQDNSSKLNTILNSFGVKAMVVSNSQPRCSSPMTYVGVDYAKISPNSKYVVTASKDTAKLWNLSTGKEIYSFVVNDCPACTINSIFFSSDSKYIVITTQRSGDITIWDVSTGKKIKNFQGHTWEINSACFSPDDKFIISASNDNTARVWDVSSGEEIQNLQGQEDYLNSASFSPDVKYVAASSEKSIRIWEVASGKQFHDLKMNNEINDIVCFSNDGKYIVTSSIDGKARIWNTLTGQEFHVLNVSDGEVYSASFSPNNKYIVTTSVDDIVKLWDVITGKEIKSFEGHTNSVFSASFSPDGKYIVTASGDGSAKIWESETGKKLFDLQGHKWFVTNATFSSNGKYVITASMDNTARLWDAYSGKEIQVFSGCAK